MFQAIRAVWDNVNQSECIYGYNYFGQRIPLIFLLGGGWYEMYWLSSSIWFVSICFCGLCWSQLASPVQTSPKWLVPQLGSVETCIQESVLHWKYYVSEITVGNMFIVTSTTWQPYLVHKHRQMKNIKILKSHLFTNYNNEIPMLQLTWYVFKSHCLETSCFNLYN